MCQIRFVIRLSYGRGKKFSFKRKQTVMFQTMMSCTLVATKTIGTGIWKSKFGRTAKQPLLDASTIALIKAMNSLVSRWVDPLFHSTSGGPDDTFVQQACVTTT